MEYQVTSNALAGRVILVTGAGAGIGRQAALSYAEKGATVILLGRTVKKLEAVYDEIDAMGAPQPAIIPLDMLGATRQHYMDMADTIEQQFGRLDGVLHNAGLLGVLSPFDQIDEKSHDDVMQVNVKATMLMTQALLPLLKKSDDARIVFTTSTVGHQGRAYWGSYAISKFATEGMMQVLADEMSDTKVRVNAINPGGTRTSMRASAFPGEDPQTLKTPLDIMPLYIYLMAPEGINEHGQCIDAQPKR
ncbi:MULTISPECIES: YciK family oxidoreductase [Salinivibrio]|uniref:YciK family oxidoreductase n=2 Tax=Salinivibrio TaxID=51366 RepID=A0ABY7LFC9_9GAMM|nr:MULTISPECIES: YciK family oxidoreductase [Salinivibrio]ODP97840.1 YciK family oxidoreductase [Salinivibrio sp. DV]OOF09718.1 YciK family oxidoreductase [Salinivibrio sp. PR5]OOF13366.1 YciK family oxidoreductase [Salinivibrio sp. PR919]OOF14626.1 YciK family oxidoreductase [Salinivibrio sp. PR932]OOF19844.1 YciK family oxidoreductase [Salinivibrio sp. IB574]